MKNKRFFLFIVTFNFIAFVHAQNYQFTVYNMSNTPVFTTNAFKGAAIGLHDNIWVGSAGQGLYRFNGKNWQKAPILTSNSIRGVYMSPADSTIWISQSGTGSTGSGTNINGGVNHIQDTLYAMIYYGALTGLPSRACYGIYVDEFNPANAWSAHWPNTTASVVTGGGIGKIETGSSNASKILDGLPSGNYSSETMCTSIGSGIGADEIWVGVARSCYKGVCNPAYIAKYNKDGIYRGNITASNSLIPFSSDVAGPVARAIDFDSNNRVWIGLSTGGVAVCDNSTKEWILLNEDNSLFPAGASVNFQSITHNSTGYVFIGTSAGLLVYYGGDLNQTANFKIYSTVDGLPSPNITGIAISKNDKIWLSTSAGIVSMLNT